MQTPKKSTSYHQFSHLVHHVALANLLATSILAPPEHANLQTFPMEKCSANWHCFTDTLGHKWKASSAVCYGVDHRKD